MLAMPVGDLLPRGNVPTVNAEVESLGFRAGQKTRNSVDIGPTYLFNRFAFRNADTALFTEEVLEYDAEQLLRMPQARSGWNHGGEQVRQGRP
jgi:hypothetical protein